MHGVAGHPESYFRQPDYLQAALSTGLTRNEVFAARITWGTMTELTGRLGLLYPAHDPFDRYARYGLAGMVRFGRY